MRSAHRIAVAFVLALVSRSAEAFPHVVKPGETLAQIAGRVYGDARKETVLAGANALDAQGGSAIVAGLRLEIPAPGHHTVGPGDTWGSLALAWLGDARRSDVLARVNHAVPWVDPPLGLAVEIPAVLAHIAVDGDTSSTLAARYWGDANRGWELNAFNGRSEGPIHRGEIILVWLVDIELTAAGREEAVLASVRTESETDTERLDVQRRADAELPLLLSDLRTADYVRAVARANRVIGSGPLTRPELAIAYRALLEAYVALGSRDEATSACASWKANDPSPELAPRLTSPKIRAVCSVGAQARPR
jgi:hypothetical protein